MLGGKYGFMFDGKISCPAVFESIKRISDGYFALATYPYYMYRNKVTVIDSHGHDLNVALYGSVRQDGDIFSGQAVSGKKVYWDGIGRTYYDRLPEFERVGNLDMIRVGMNQYKLRRPSPLMPYMVTKKDIFYNDKLTVINDIIILNDENGTVLKPFLYFGNKMQIKTRKDGKHAYRWVTLSKGLTDEYTTDMYFDGSVHPYWKNARMINAATGKMEYMSPAWVEKEERRTAFRELRRKLDRNGDSWSISEDMIQAQIKRRKR